MGTDIHAAIEWRDADGWHALMQPNKYFGRWDSRGIPDDVTAETKQVLSDEHSGTWVTLPEILAFDWTRATVHYGVINAETFEKWDRRKEWNAAPDNYAGDVSGQRVRKVTPDEMRAYVKTVTDGKYDENLYARVEWQESYPESGVKMWTKILPHMLKLGAAHGFDNVRMVMDYDS